MAFSFIQTTNYQMFVWMLINIQVNNYGHDETVY